MVTITISGNEILVDFTGLAGTANEQRYLKSSYLKEDIRQVHLMSDHVIVQGKETSDQWEVSHEVNNDNFLPIQSIDGVAPTDLEHLFQLLKNLRVTP